MMDGITNNLILNQGEITIDSSKDIALFYGECPYCHGIFATDWTYVEYWSSVVYCPMCCMKVDFGEE